MQFFNFKKSAKLNRIFSIALVIGIVLSTPAIGGGQAMEFLKGEKIFMASQSGRDQAKDELDDVNDRLEDLEEEQQEIKNQLNAKTEELSSILADKVILENDIAATQAAIEETEIELELAKQQEAESYEAMKIRIQYMYKNSTKDSLWDAIINARGIADLLKRVEYVSQVYTSDRKLLEDYKKVVEETELLASSLEANMNEMVALQEIYEHQQAQLDRKSVV